MPMYIPPPFAVSSTGAITVSTASGNFPLTINGGANNSYLQCIRTGSNVLFGVDAAWGATVQTQTGPAQVTLLPGGTASMGVTPSAAMLASTMNYIWSSGALGAATDTGLGRNAAGVVEVNNSTTGAYRDLKARNLITNATTVAGLTPAATAGAGARSFVTDANAAAFLSVAAGGGTNKVPVVSDGANWLIG